MLVFELSADKQHLQLIQHDSKAELKDLQLYFKKRQQGYFHNTLYKRKLWDGYDHFVKSKEDVHLIGVGLWREIINFGEKNDYQIEIRGLKDLLNLDFTKEKSDKFTAVLLDGTNPQLTAYDYQLEAVHRGLKYKFCAQELATSSGKTLIFFIYLSFLKRKGVITKGRKALLVVPRMGLVNQTAEKFQKDYQTGLVEWDIHKIGGKNKFDQRKFDNCDLLISTYQSLLSKPAEFFEQFSVVCIDECHTSRGDSIRDILLASKTVEYKLGLSGTIKIEEQFSDFFKIQEYLGPLSMVVKASFLIDQKHSPNVLVKMLRLKYPTDEPFVQKYLALQEQGGVNGKKMYEIEKAFIVSYVPRIEFISKLCEKLEGNKLVLFTNIKDSYGQRIQDKIRELNPNVYYIDGGVKENDRADYKEIMETGKGIVLVASYGTFAVGIDLKNVNYIIFTESYKAEITIRQSIGRGMRKLIGKQKITILDLVDDLNGYVVRHSKVREKIYLREKFIVTKQDFDLKKFIY